MEIAIKTFLAAWFITNFEPITEHTKELYSKYFNSYLRIGFEILTCFKCLSFWLIFAMTFDPFYAIAGSFIATIYDEVTGK